MEQRLESLVKSMFKNFISGQQMHGSSVSGLVQPVLGRRYLRLRAPEPSKKEERVHDPASSYGHRGWLGCRGGIGRNLGQTLGIPSTVLLKAATQEGSLPRVGGRVFTFCAFVTTSVHIEKRTAAR